MRPDRQLYFLRHGLADWPSWSGSDHERPLTEEGKRRMAREAACMERLGLDFDVILTSPLVRARQTAEIVAEQLGAGDVLREDIRLDGRFDVVELANILDDLAATMTRVLLVGHEPTFSLVIGAITGGSHVVCKKGSLARVDVMPGPALDGCLMWLLPPRVLVA